MVKEKNLSEAVVFHGLQSNVHEFLCDMDMFTLPSLYEGIPMSIAEAMGTGLPIVATNVGGIPDMITSGENGLLCNTYSQSIVRAFSSFMESKELRECCSKADFLR